MCGARMPPRAWPEERAAGTGTGEPRPRAGGAVVPAGGARPGQLRGSVLLRPSLEVHPGPAGPRRPAPGRAQSGPLGQGLFVGAF